MRVINKTKNIVLAEETKIARSVFSRLKGLMGKRTMNPEEALVLDPCNSIHTFFMNFSIDVIFLNRQDEVVDVVFNMQINKLSKLYFSAHYVIEFFHGVLKPENISKGDRIALE